MGNDNTKIDADLGWTATELSCFILGLNQEQVAVYFGNRKKVAKEHLITVLLNCVFAYLKHKNKRKFPNVKASKINACIDEFQQTSQKSVEQELMPIENWLMQNKLSDVKFVTPQDLLKTVAVWLEQYDNTMSTL